MTEFPDIFACVSCDKALFLYENERTSGSHTCPFCQHEHVPADAIQVDDESGATDGDVETTPEEIVTNESSTDEDGGEELFIEEEGELSDQAPAETQQAPNELELFTEESSEEQELGSVDEPPVEDDEGSSIEEPAEAETPPENVELPDVFACLSCDNALFLNETERASGDFLCPQCGQKNAAVDTRAVAAEQLKAVEADVNPPTQEQKFPELIECPECERAIQLTSEQRDEDSVNCPYCEADIAAPEPPEEEEASEELIELKDAEPAVAESDDSLLEETGQVAADELGEDGTVDEPEPDETGGQEDAPLSDDKAGGGEDSDAGSGEAQEGDPVEAFADEDPVGEEAGENESGEAAVQVDTGLLGNLIESSKNQSLMPERFSCPKCETEIQSPEAERQMGLCFCPECEELIDSKTALEHTHEEPQAVEGKEDEGGGTATEENSESAVKEGEGTSEEPQKQDLTAAQEKATQGTEFWLNNVLPASVDCAKCDNSLKLDDKEKVLGLYRCPYCKAHINHAKESVVESIIPKANGEEDETPLKKRKPFNFKALLPYAAVLVFGVALNYTVVWATNYFQKKKELKAQWVSLLKADELEMGKRTDVYDVVLEDSGNKEKLDRLEKLSVTELKAFRSMLMNAREKAYADWFQDTGTGIVTNLIFGPVVNGFQGKLDRFMRRVDLAKIDADNLETAIGISAFERQRAQELLKDHLKSIREQMSSLSEDRAIELGLVRPEMLSDLMELSLKVEHFKMYSVQQAVVHLDTMSRMAGAMQERYRLNHASASQGYELKHDDGHASRAHAEPGTIWNAEVFQWQGFNKEREHDHQVQWDGIAVAYRQLMDSFSGLHRQLEVLRRDADLSPFQHPFLDSGVLALRVDEFSKLEGVGDLVRHDVQSRLERLAKLLDPYSPGSLAYELNVKKTAGGKLTHDQADELYGRFWEKWKQFHLEKQWFELEGVSSYYHLARVGGHGSHASSGAHH